MSAAEIGQSIGSHGSIVARSLKRAWTRSVARRGEERKSKRRDAQGRIVRTVRIMLELSESGSVRLEATVLDAEALPPPPQRAASLVHACRQCAQSGGSRSPSTPAARPPAPVRSMSSSATYRQSFNLAAVRLQEPPPISIARSSSGKNFAIWPKQHSAECLSPGSSSHSSGVQARSTSPNDCNRSQTAARVDSSTRQVLDRMICIRLLNEVLEGMDVAEHQLVPGLLRLTVESFCSCTGRRTIEHAVDVEEDVARIFFRWVRSRRARGRSRPLVLS